MDKQMVHARSMMPGIIILKRWSKGASKNIHIDIAYILDSLQIIPDIDTVYCNKKYLLRNWLLHSDIWSLTDKNYPVTIL